MAHRFADFKRQAEAERAAEAGEAVPDDEIATRPASDLSSVIEAEMRRAGAMPPSEVRTDDADERGE